jgi:hypothetical protein
MAATIDFQPYARSPRIDALGGVALAKRLLRVGYAGSTPGTVRALAKVRAASAQVEAALKTRARTTRTGLRPLDAAFDNGWSAIRDRLFAWTLVHDPSQESERARAEQLLASYFPDGVDFVKIAYEKEWVHSDQLLERFRDEAVLADLERLVGAPFLANARLQHERLGAALGLFGTDPAAPADAESVSAGAASLADAVVALSMAIGDYTRRYAGEVDTDDPESVAAFRKAMAPLDAYRAAGGAGKGEPTDEESDPVAPTDEPELPSPFIKT